MINLDIARRRLYNQHIASTLFEKPVDIVSWLGAVQAQDYTGALWALGLRMRQATVKDIEQAIADKSIVRLWFMRGTLHFVPGADLRWMLQIMAPRMRKLLDHALNYLKLALDEDSLTRSNEVLVRTLQGGRQLTREELAVALEEAGISAQGLQRSFLIQRAQTDGLLCYAAPRGKQATFALLDEWVPSTRLLTRDEALAEFARRYFVSHGPATLQDFVWWSGLTTSEAKTGLEMVKSVLLCERIDEQMYWFAPVSLPAPGDGVSAYLLPNYDEYMVGYTDRSAIFDGAYTEQLDSRARGGILANTIVVNGQIVGTWTRVLRKNSLTIEPHLVLPLQQAESQAVAEAAQRYGAFLDQSVSIS
ncbi:MAG TPA: winged helix DNA-binding domain-containing protein [Ktedonobacteraceae bacterium]